MATASKKTSKRTSKKTSRKRATAPAKASTPKAVSAPRAGGMGIKGAVTSMSNVSIDESSRRGSDYTALFEQMRGLSLDKPEQVITVPLPEGVDAKQMQARINNAMYTQNFERPKGTTYRKQPGTDKDGNPCLVISITSERKRSA